MKLTIDGIRDTAAYAAAGITLPAFDVTAMQERGRTDPRWLHVGPGNIFRVFLARIADDMLSDGRHWPVTAVAPMGPDELDTQLGAHDYLSLGVTLNPDGTRDQRVIAGMSEGLATRRPEDHARLLDLIKDPRVTLVSFTITEKGYAVHDSTGALSDDVRRATASDPRAYQPHTMALIASVLLHRFEHGGAPLTLMSCDNFSHNGDKLRDSVLTVAQGWEEAGSVSAAFVNWLADRSQVAFPITVIDKITPRPNASIAADLLAVGVEDAGITTVGRTAVAGFVNTEPTEYLIIEDSFAAERPPFERYGAHVVAREVCDEFENMKVTTCLNPLHTALAVAGVLLRMPTIDAEMRDDALRALVTRLGWVEGLPVVSDPGVVDPADFLTEVLEVRFTNPYLPDDPARIAMDTSQKMPIRFGETLKRYRERGLDMGCLQAIPLVIALWCRYLMGVADDGAPFEPAPDPLYDELHAHVAGVGLSGPLTPEQAREVLHPILSNAALFALDLTGTPLAAKVESYFTRLVAGPGAVRTTLDKELL
ncbi:MULTISPECIES: mannitol dehydrogenase family protein [unclassified Actinomyces]|uniref:mannitol dehydrogenase family protein n=1 Tax=unclassified Actinomyces TaxID=2609248 RepID=UPI0020177307|nr:MULTISPECIES: mannitol dehydrogenase family protein [unclassified Actinomyces]MCL3778277.1 mannitol dehydrogenase family protein [Actinomyces sp. AC-20-1]MCL3788739.1 mannitol dehydrogenase family protein [Actinomyces sp. 187325]MCL3792854.1 mannitol dehydrogenase family protein [Actinomyces sp. 186855]MCL3794369.1 mannitol dehydrogenase family protein [Actinomyces sp. 217892]